VVGGNIKPSESTHSTVRLNIVTLRWEELPNLIYSRANCGSFVTKDGQWLYAFGGFNFPAG